MGNSLKILIADDESIGRQLLEAILVPEGYRICLASDGQKALELALHEDPDIILLDVMMPYLDGFEVCRKLREHETTAHTPIFLITALDDRDSRLRGIEVGADDYISKPFDRVEILGKLKNKSRFIQHHKKVMKGDSPSEGSMEHGASRDALYRALIGKITEAPHNDDRISVYTKFQGYYSKNTFTKRTKGTTDFFLFSNNKLNGEAAALANANLIIDWTNFLLHADVPVSSGLLDDFLVHQNELIPVKDFTLAWIGLNRDKIKLSGLNQNVLIAESGNSPQMFRLFPLDYKKEIRLQLPVSILLLSPGFFPGNKNDELISWLNTNQPEISDPAVLKQLGELFGTEDDALIVSLEC